MSIADARFGWIEACLRYAGAFGAREKGAYLKIFGVSESAMSRHQWEFAHRFEEYVGRKVFKRSKRMTFESGKLALLPGEAIPEENLFPLPDLESWLNDSMGPQFERVRVVMRQSPDETVLREVVSAIKSKKPLTIEYVSRSGAKTSRNISPHILVDVVGRYHVRAFDHSKSRYGDFVLARIRCCYPPAAGRSAPFVGPEGDDDWHNKDGILIKARAAYVSDGVRADWGLDEFGVKLTFARRALISYLIDDTDKGYESPVSVTRAN